VIVVSLSNLTDDIGSGGILRLVQILRRRDSRIKLTVVCTELGRRAYEKELHATYAVLKKNINSNVASMKGTITLYLEMMLRSALMSLDNFGLKNDSVVYAGSMYLPDVLAAVRVKKSRLGIAYIQVFHNKVANPWKRKGNFLSNTLAYFDQKLALKLSKKYADKFIVVNDDLKTFLVEQGVDHQKIAVNFNGVDLEYVQKIRPNKNLDCAFVGRIDPNKGVKDLIEIMKYVVKQRPSTRFAVIGGGLRKNVSWFNEQVERNELSKNIVATGRIDNASVIALLKGCKVLAFPSREESFGIVIVEALACSCVPIVWDLPIFVKLFPDGARMIRSFDHESFAEELVTLCDDQEGRKTILDKGRYLLDIYNWHAIATKEFEIIRSTLAKSNIETDHHAEWATDHSASVS
jgi:glycosyltransferase involved in cell wall biosynthesis